MSTLLKSLLALAVALPLGGYVAGTLVASGSEPAPREPVIIRERPSRPPPNRAAAAGPTGAPAGPRTMTAAGVVAAATMMMTAAST